MAEGESSEPDASAHASQAGAESDPVVDRMEEAGVFVQRMIDAAFIRHDMTHGHLSPEDGAAQLAALGDHKTR